MRIPSFDSVVDAIDYGIRRRRPLMAEFLRDMLVLKLARYFVDASAPPGSLRNYGQAELRALEWAFQDPQPLDHSSSLR